MANRRRVPRPPTHAHLRPRTPIGGQATWRTESRHESARDRREWLACEREEGKDGERRERKMHRDVLRRTWTRARSDRTFLSSPLPRPPAELLLDAHSPSCCSSSPPAAALRHSSFPFFRLFVPRAETSSIGHVGARARTFISSLLPLIFFARGRVFAGRSITTEFFFRRYFELFIGP